MTTSVDGSREESVTFDVEGLEVLRAHLADDGYEVHGPQVRDGAIIHDVLRSAADLPIGVTDEQSGGRYRLLPRADKARFGYAVGPQSWKEVLHPPRTKVWAITRDTSEPLPEGPADTSGSSTAASGETSVALRVRMNQPEVTPRAFLGVRPCELAAIAKLDRVLLHGPHPDPTYRANRENVFVVAVNCGSPAATCFCTSMETGPEAGPGYDIALTELVTGQDVRYVGKAGTERGATVLAALTTLPATENEQNAAQEVVNTAAETITRRLDTDRIKDVLYDNLESAQWDEIAERCLSCGNCTLACPTCFCTNMEDVTDLSGDNTDRWRVWDSCFSLEFSHLGPGPVRSSTKSRYRQWLVHKLGSWHDQFDESGCVGCGRCITWCPVGIDLTAELPLMRRSDR